MTEKTMDMRGLKCPLPTLLVKKALTALAPGDLIVAQCTDPMAAIDIPHAVQESGDILEGKDVVTAENVAQDSGPNLLIFRIRKR